MGGTTKWSAVAAVLLIAIAIIVYTQFTIFVVHPIGAVPEGRTLIISRVGQLRFVDSADGICARTAGGVSLICRAAVLAKIGQAATIHARLPYSETLYEISTGGVTYDR